MFSAYEPKLGERLVEISSMVNVTTKVWADSGLSNEQMEGELASELQRFADIFIAPAPSPEHPYLLSRDSSVSVIVKDTEK